MAVSCFLAYELEECTCSHDGSGEECEPGSIEDMIAYTLLEDTWMYLLESMGRFHG